MEDGRTTKVAQNKKIKGEAHRRTEERKEGARSTYIFSRWDHLFYYIILQSKLYTKNIYYYAYVLYITYVGIIGRYVGIIGDLT